MTEILVSNIGYLEDCAFSLNRFGLVVAMYVRLLCVVPFPCDSPREAKEVLREQSRLSLAIRSHDQIQALHPPPVSHETQPLHPHTSENILKVLFTLYFYFLLNTNT